MARAGLLTSRPTASHPALGHAGRGRSGAPAPALGPPRRHSTSWAEANPTSTRPDPSTPASPRPRCTSTRTTEREYVDENHRARGVGRALIHRQVTAPDAAGLWTLQAAIFTENRAAIALHHSAGYRTLGVREGIGQHHGAWRDTVFLERRSSRA
ncbi:N-acetyltransferase family protein [Actinomycetospora sp. CA-101289]|uniref:GNAT family N-acetyltransferase n=1 Tax=Actinomycetospora sp. CA-101289 TaxID=3239893 RepID=UPI003D9737D9